MEGEAARNDAASRPVVSVAGLAKRYPLFGRRRDRLLAFAGRTAGLRWKTALEDVSFTARPGEALGIIGENGSGKSTLLRIVSGISTPSAGTLDVGRPVAAILELGLGFHPEFTGRENALLYGRLMGVDEETMDARLDDVLAFAELGEFIDQPLRTYSSGMAARLAFSVVTNVSARVLVVDEALAVGDGAFQKKCVDRMVEIKEEGASILFCSHAMYLIAGFCERALWLRDGRIEALGAARDVIHAYEDYLRRKGRRLAEAGDTTPTESGRPASITAVTVSPADGSLRAGDAAAVRCTIRRATAGVPLHVAITFENRDGLVLWAAATRWEGLPPLSGGELEEVAVRLPRSPFTRDELDVNVFLADETGLQVLDQVCLPRALRVAGSRWEPGMVEIPHEWEIGGG